MNRLDERWRNAHRILAMRLDNLGDVVMTGPALRAIKEALPGVHLTLMVSYGAHPAVQLLPWVDEALPWRSLWQDMGDLPFDPDREFGLIQTLHALRFDAAIIFTSFAQSPYVAAYVCYLAGIPLRLGEPKDFAGSVLSDVPATLTAREAHQVERNLALLEAVGLHASDRSLAVHIPPQAHVGAATLLAQQGLPMGASYVLLCPWTSCQARTYPRFGLAAQRLHRATGLPIVLAGAPRCRGAAHELLGRIGPGAIDLVGRTSVAELAALVAGARLLLTNNTLAMHLADATRTPQVVLFAGTELEEQWAPRHAPTRLLQRATPCRPCFQFTCPHDQECLKVDPDEVAAAGLELLSAAQRREAALGIEEAS